MAAGRRQRDARRDDDERRFASVYPGLRRFAAAVGPPGVEPDDLVQEALARALRRRSLGEYDNLSSYLHTTVLNLAKNHRRSWSRSVRALRRLGTQPEEPDSYPSDLADLLRLPADARAVLYLIEVEGRSFAEVADELGLSPEAARTRASRARKTLRDLIGPELGPYLEVRDANT